METPWQVARETSEKKEKLVPCFLNEGFRVFSCGPTNGVASLGINSEASTGPTS